MGSPPRTGILFICLGNICRSPLAEAVFRDKAQKRSADHFLIDSAGTGDWHAGEPPDRRAVTVASRHGLRLDGRARQVTPDDFRRFHHIICMDDANLRHLQRLGAPRGKLRLLLEADPSAGRRDVPDPYYAGDDGFDEVYRLIDSACEALLAELLGR